MRIDAHTHGMDAKCDGNGIPRPPVFPIWKGNDPAKHIEYCQSKGIDKVVLVDPPSVVFKMKKLFGDFVISVPQVDLDIVCQNEVQSLFDQGAAGIKFISPEYSYGDDRYFPIYEVVAENHGLAEFHTGYLGLRLFDPKGLMMRRKFPNIELMRPAALDRIARAFPGLDILMSHFGNPWWEEAWKVMTSHKRIYADFSGGTACTRDMNMWKTLFAPNGIRDDDAISKLCFATDGTVFTPECYDDSKIMAFYDSFFDMFSLSQEQCDMINYENIAKLTGGI